MRRSNRRYCWLATIAVLWAVGCSGESSSPVLTTGPSTAEWPDASPLDQAISPPETVAPTQIEAKQSAESLPDTPDGTVQAVFEGLREGHPDILWEALPASYQRDVNDIAHLAANRLNPDAWRWYQHIARKGARLTRAYLAQNTSPDEPGRDFNEVTIRSLESLAGLLDSIASSGPTPLESLKTADVGDLLRQHGQALVPTFIDLIGIVDCDMPRSLEQALQISVRVKEITEDSAVLEFESPETNATAMDFVRIEGKWVPRVLADQWSSVLQNARKEISDLLPSEDARENYGMPFVALGSVEMTINMLLRQIEHPHTDPDGLYGDSLSFISRSLMMLGYVLGGPPTVEPDFSKRAEGESLKAKGKVALVYCFAPKELKFDNESMDYDLAKHVAYQLNAHKIKVVDPDRVYAWLEKNSGWKHVSEIGAAFNADYVVHIDLLDYSLFEINSQYLNRGRAECIINVVKMDDEKKAGSVIYSQAMKSNFPLRGPIDSSSMAHNEFRKRYLSFLSDEIGRLFYPVEIGNDAER